MWSLRFRSAGKKNHLMFRLLAAFFCFACWESELFLALGAIVGAATSEFNFYNCGVTRLVVGRAIFARVTRSIINLQVGGEATARAITPAVISNTRATVLDRESKHRADGAVKLHLFHRSEGDNSAGRSNSCPKTRFININISQPGNQSLIEEKSFNFSFRMTIENLFEGGDGEIG